MSTPEPQSGELFGATKSIIYRGITIIYESYDSFTPMPSSSVALVFLHGWTCASSLWHYGQTPLFNQYRSLLIDLPGHGASSAPTGIEYSHELFARSVNAVLDEEGVTSVVFVGHDMGGPVATMVTRLWPEKVKAIIYVDSFLHSPEHYDSSLKRRLRAEAYKGEQFKTAFDRTWTIRSSEDVKRLVGSLTMTTEEHVRINAAATDSLPHAWRWDEVYDIPALQILAPTGGNKATLDGKWKHHFPNLQLEVWNGHSHFCFMEDPERFNDSVRGFLENHGMSGHEGG